ncbi:MAG: hypothetical protein ABMB14_00145, partial [Myxococcota bacterium]
MLAWLPFACTPSPVSDPAAVYDPDADGFFGTPWPSDQRRDDDGTISMDGFPNPFAVPLVQNYLDHADALD